jgi:hypothetical protein
MYVAFSIVEMLRVLAPRSDFLDDSMEVQLFLFHAVGIEQLLECALTAGVLHGTLRRPAHAGDSQRSHVRRGPADVVQHSQGSVRHASSSACACTGLWAARGLSQTKAYLLILDFEDKTIHLNLLQTLLAACRRVSAAAMHT